MIDETDETDKNDTEELVQRLERLAEELRATDDAYASPGAMGDKVSGLRVIRNGNIIQEWEA